MVNNNYKQTQKDGKCYVCVDIGLELLELHGKVFFGLLDSDDHRPINSNIIFRSVVTTDVNNVITDGNMDCDDMTNKYVI